MKTHLQLIIIIIVTVRSLSSRVLRCAGHVARMEE
jgi:hypothetical protein